MRKTPSRWKGGALVSALIIFALVVSALVGTGALKSRSRNAAFDAVQLGDREAAVISRFGEEPSVREKADAIFARYASQPCSGECIQRLWFENRLSLDTQAWSIELDKNGRTIKKSRWVSP